MPGTETPLAVARLEEHRFEVKGSEVERLVAMTNLDNEEAVLHLHRQLQRLGAIRLLREAGAQEGDKVLIGGNEFDFSE